MTLTLCVQYPNADHCLTWSVAPIPKDLQRRYVEITGPTDRKMVINALNSGSDMFMADFEDSLSPTWRNTMEGQINLLAANKRTIEFKNPDGKSELKLCLFQFAVQSVSMKWNS